jgi:hypothetical protein
MFYITIDIIRWPTIIMLVELYVCNCQENSLVSVKFCFDNFKEY